MISEFFVDRPKFALVVSIVITIVGAIAIYFIPIAEYPDITPPEVVVNATYPGANASTIENTVAIPIEEQVNGVDNMIYMSSTSSNDGTYQLIVTFEVGTDPDIAAVNVQNRVALAGPQIPQAVTQQGITTQKQSSAMLLVINLLSTDKEHDEIFLSNYGSNFLQDPLARIPGVGDVAQFGPQTYSMRVWIDPNKLTSLGLSASDLSNAIKAQNVEATAGQVGAAPFGGDTQFRFTLDAKGRLDTVEEFGDIIVRSDADSSVLRLKDMARLELGSRSYAVDTTLNNRPSAAIAIYQSPDANALNVAEAVYAEMEKLKKNFPQGVEYKILYDVTKAVKESIEEIVETLFITGLLVITVTFIFLASWRSTLVPAIAIPVSLIGTVAILYIVGFSANLITLFALILAITLVVDDSIVIVENSERIMDEEGLEPREATLKAMDQVTRPIIATTFVLAAVFVPVCFFPGITGRVYLQFALTITTAFALSAVNALTLGPVLCAGLLKRKAGEPLKPLAMFGRFVTYVRDRYVIIVSWLLDRAALAMVAVGLVLAAIVGMFLTTPTAFIPTEDKGALMVNVQLPSGASLQRTNAVIKEMTTLVEDVDGVADVIGISGYSLMAGSASNYGTLIAILKPWDERKSSQTQWYNILFAIDRTLGTVPTASAFAFPLPPINGLGISGGLNGQLQDYGDSGLQALGSAARSLVIDASSSPVFRRVFTTFSASDPEYFVDIDRDQAEAVGVQVSDIFTALQATLGTLYVNNFTLDGRLYWVIISAEAAYRSNLRDIDRIQVQNSAGDMVPLQALVTIKSQLGSENIGRYNMFTTAPISGMTATGYSSGQAIAAVEKIVSSSLPDGYGIEWTGISLQEVEASGLIIYIFIAAFMFAYFFLVAQYESWSLPLAVMLSASFAVFGAILPIWALSVLNNNIYCQIGIVLLIGLAAKKAIMLVAFSVARREEGESIREAAMSAAHTRFRPVTMTGLCFIIGVIPLVLASGAGASSRLSLGVVVLSGMIADSFIGLIFIPILYYVFQSMRENVKSEFKFGSLRDRVTALMPNASAPKTPTRRKRAPSKARKPKSA